MELSVENKDKGKLGFSVLPNIRKMDCPSQIGQNVINYDMFTLKNTSQNDEHAISLLRSRIDEQSKLIMIQKRSADESLLTIRTLNNRNNEIEELHQGLTSSLENKTKTLTLLESRFDELAKNHEQLIKFKDEYKSQNQILMKENERLKEENRNLFSNAISEKDEEIRTFEKKLISLKEQYSQRTNENRDLEEQMKNMKAKHEEDMTDLKKNHAEKEDILKGTILKESENQKKNDKELNDLKTRLQTILKEKEDLSKLTMERGRMIQEKTRESESFKEMMGKLSAHMKEMDDKLLKQKEEFDSNKTIDHLKNELDIADKKMTVLKKEFEVFRKYSAELLEREKELNNKLCFSISR